MSGAAILKQNDRRTVCRVDPADCSLPSLVIKHDHPVRWRDRIKSLWRCKARREFEIGRRLASAGVPCVPMLAWGSRGSESWLVTRRVRGTMPLLPAWRSCRRKPRRRAAFIAALARFLRRLRNAGVTHGDLHRDNVLVARKGRRFKLLLVDVIEARVGAADGRQVLHDLMLLLGGFVPLLRQHEIEKIRDAAVTPEEGGDTEASWRDALAETCARFVRYRRARMHKVLTDGRFCRRLENEAGVWLIRRSFAPEAAEQAVREHQRLQREVPGDLLHRDENSSVSRVSVGNRTVEVHEMRRPADDAESPARRRWLHTYCVYGPGLHAATHHAWLAGHDGVDFLVCDHLRGPSLIDAIKDPASVRRLFGAAGRLLAHFHAAGLAGPVPASALVAIERPINALCEIGLIHAADVRFVGPISDDDRATDLRGFCASLPSAVAARGRAWLLAAYRRRSGYSGHDLRRLLADGNRAG